MRSLLIASFSFFMLVIVTPLVAADLRGQVLQGNGAPAGNVTISLKEGQNSRTATTNGSGFYEFRNITPGTYTLTIKGQNEQVRVSPQGTERNIRLP